MPLVRQETGLSLCRLAEGEVDPIGRPGLALYKGNCHCGRNGFEVHLREEEITNALACDCSLCHKVGYLWAWPKPEDINYTRGKESTLAVFESTNLRHKFCTSCGTGLYGTHLYGPWKGASLINVRCILGINPFNIKAKKADTGEYVHEGPIETPPVLLNALAQLKPPSGEIGTLQQKGSEPISTIKTYTGSCYCSAVFFAVKTPPLSQVEIKEDNCSICVRRAATTIYPDQDQVLFHLSGQVLGAGSINEANSATTDTTTYAFGRKFNQFPFCKTCGVACFGIPVGPPPEVVSRLPPEKQMFVEKLRRIRPLYLRAMNDVEWDEIDVVRSDEGAEGYVVGAEIPDNEAKDESDC